MASGTWSDFKKHGHGPPELGRILKNEVMARKQGKTGKLFRIKMSCHQGRQRTKNYYVYLLDITYHSPLSPLPLPFFIPIASPPRTRPGSGRQGTHSCPVHPVTPTHPAPLRQASQKKNLILFRIRRESQHCAVVALKQDELLF